MSDNAQFNECCTRQALEAATEKHHIEVDKFLEDLLRDSKRRKIDFEI